MNENVRDQLPIRLRRAALTVFAIGAAAAGTVHASPSRTVVVVPPTDLPALTLPGPISNAGNNAFTVTSPTMDAPPALDFGAIDTVLSYELDRMFDVKQIRAQMARSDTGTIFMLTENGLCDQAPGRKMDSSVDGDSP